MSSAQASSRVRYVTEQDQSSKNFSEDEVDKKESGRDSSLGVRPKVPSGATKVPDRLATKCEELGVPVCLASATVPSSPIMFMNTKFGELSGWHAEEALGKECLFLRGELTEQTLSDELALSIRQRDDFSAALINYHRNGSLFFNLVSFRQLYVLGGAPLLMACHTAFEPAAGARPYQRVLSRVDNVWRRIRMGMTFSPNALTKNDLYQLETISIRFETAFLRAQNTLIRRPSTGSVSRLAELAQLQERRMFERKILTNKP